MEKVPGLKTLGDYRRAAKESLFSIHLPPENKSTSDYDAIKTALINSRNLIYSSRINPPDPGTWCGTTHTGTKYEMINPQQFKYIKLMEFTKRYHEVKSIDELFPNLRERTNLNISVFASAGHTFLEAAFNFLLKFGRDIILSSLQDAYNKYRKEKNIHGRFDLLGSTPEVIDKLKINPKPDIIIKTWFDSMVNKVKWRFEEFSDIKVEENFDSIFMQIEYEWDDWEKGRQLPVKRLGQQHDLTVQPAAVQTGPKRQVKMQLNESQRQLQPNQYLADVSKQINEVHKHIPFFRGYWQQFCRMVEKYATHLDQCRTDPHLRIAREAIKKETEQFEAYIDKQQKLYDQCTELCHKWNEAEETQLNPLIMGGEAVKSETERFDAYIDKQQKIYERCMELYHKGNEAEDAGDSKISELCDAFKHKKAELCDAFRHKAGDSKKAELCDAFKHKITELCDAVRHEKEAEIRRLESQQPRHKPPEPGCVKSLMEHCSYLKLDIKPLEPINLAFWIRPGPVNPLPWLGLCLGLYTNAVIQRKPNDDELLMCDAVILSVTHDECGELDFVEKRVYRNEKYNGNYFKRDDFCWSLRRALEHNQGRIKRAFGNIEPHLIKWREEGADSATGEVKSKRRSYTEKFAAITSHLKNDPGASSKDIQKATGIDASDVRHIWAPIKKAMKAGKRAKQSGKKADGIIEVVDESASCKICDIPLLSSFECAACKEVVIGECKTCHFTNEHTDKAMP